MLERLLPWWSGKLFVLVLLGFVATDFIITITLSAADATAHLVENPLRPASCTATRSPSPSRCSPCWGRSSSRGFKEAIGIAVALVAAYLALNAVVVGCRPGPVADAPAGVLGDWTARCCHAARQPARDGRRRAARVSRSWRWASPASRPASPSCRWSRATPSDTERSARRPDRGARKLLPRAALIMSVVPGAPAAWSRRCSSRRRRSRPAAPRNGRALAYLAHELPRQRRSARSTTSARSRSSGSPVRRRWRACSTSCRATCRATAWRRDWARAVRPLVFVFTGDRVRRHAHVPGRASTRRAAPTPPASWS